jgi:glycosyltransferase involved in cell wall biosynthesis
MVSSQAFPHAASSRRAGFGILNVTSVKRAKQRVSPDKGCVQGKMRNRKTHSMLPARSEDAVAFPATARPRLVIIVDAEEEFDWTAPFSRANHGVKTIAAQFRTQRIFEKFGVTPTYAVDYPVASQEDGFKPLRELMQSGACHIGAQLHPWVTPPHEELVCERNSFAGNLPPDLEQQKLEQLTEMIERNFGARPKLYRAGRYGAGSATAAIIEDLGYEVDCSVLPGQPAGALGPDYTGGTARPYWLDTNRNKILEIPVTVATVGLAERYGESLYGQLTSPLGRAMKIPGVLARLGLMERIRLTPEGTTLEEAKRLTRSMFRAGQKVFAVSYHTPSLVPGNTQYVRNEKELQTFFGWLEGYLEFFLGEMRGEMSTPLAIRDWALSLKGVENLRQSDRVMGMESGQRVSVVIPAHNSSATLARAIDSVLAQTVLPLETLIVDDCSKDDTIAVADRYADRGVKVVPLTERAGASGARNAGIRAARGELIAFLDSDDEWLPAKLEKQLRVLDADDRLSIVSCASTIISPDGKDMGDTFGGEKPTVGPDAWKALLVSNFIATPTVIARRAQLLALGCFDRNLKIGEDQDMWIRLALAGDMGFAPESLVIVHEQKNSLSNWDLDEYFRYTIPMIEKHVRALSDRLTNSEIRKIRGERIGRLGRVAYARGYRLKGAGMVLEAILLGFRPLENFYYLMTASPPAALLKTWIRSAMAR